jgi:hypothetical protein
MSFTEKKEPLTAREQISNKAANRGEPSTPVQKPGRLLSIRHSRLPLAPKPNRTMLITMKERWYHWEKEKKRVSRTS